MVCINVGYAKVSENGFKSAISNSLRNCAHPKQKSLKVLDKLNKGAILKYSDKDL